MTISYPLTPPTGGIRTVTLAGRSVVGESRDGYAGGRLTYEWPGQWWEALVNLAPMTRDEAEAWNVFRLKLNGKRGTFLLGDPNGATPRGSAAATPGTPLVAGGSQTGSEMVIDGLPTSVSGYLLEGDYIQLGSGSNSRLYKSLTDVDTDGSGQATLTLWPNVQTAPDDNDPVVVSGAVGLFSLPDNYMPWDIDEALFYGISFNAVGVV